MPPDSVRHTVERVFAAEQYRWIEGRHPLQWLRELWNRLVAWLETYGTAHPLAARLLLAGCIVLLAVILTHLAVVAWRIYRATVRAGVMGPGAAPVPPLGPDELATRADALAREGRYPAALACRFAALLLELDRREALRFHAAKTPAEYVQEARLDASGRATLADLVARLYRHLFAAEPCDAQAYDAFALSAQGLVRHVAPR